MKILQVIEATSGGAGTHTIDLSLGLQKAGHEVDMVYSEARIDDKFREGLEQIKSNGGKVFHLEISSQVDKSDFTNALKLRKIIKEHGTYNVLHLQSSKAGAVGRMARVGMYQPTVYTPHLYRTLSPGLSAKGVKRFTQIEKFLVRWSEANIMVSSYELEHAKEIGMPEKKLFKVDNGRDPFPAGDRAKLRQSLKIPDSAVVIGFIGRLVIQKDPYTLLKAFSELKTDVECYTVFIGAGPLQESLEADAVLLGIRSRTVFLGEQPGRDWLAAFDILAIPSKSESSPYVMFEAGLSKVPMIASRVGSIPDFLVNMENGLLFDPGSFESLCHKIKILVENPELRIKMAEAAFKLFSEYTVDAMVTKTVAVYNRIAKF